MKSGDMPRTLMLCARPLDLLRCDATPGRREMDSATLESGSLPMSSALMASTILSAFFFTLIALSMALRMPVTVTVWVWACACALSTSTAPATAVRVPTCRLNGDVFTGCLLVWDRNEGEPRLEGRSRKLLCLQFVPKLTF